MDPRRVEREAAAVLSEALGQAQTLHHPGARGVHRRRLERALELSSSVVAAGARGQTDPATVRGARLTQALAYAARAQDARHGAGQLSQSAQRAPTQEDCEEGWQRVEQIVTTAETAAREAARLAGELDDDRAREAARRAGAAAREARRIVDERNHAYTFHADPSFSFGEGWYLAAAGILCGVTIQIEPDKPQSAQAERFLRDAGLGPSLVPYRSRPRASKALPDLIARAFLADPLSAQAKLRAGFLGEQAIAPAIADWAQQKLAGASKRKKVLVWLRYGAYHPTRNTAYPELVELCRRALRQDLVPVLIGDALRGGEAPPGSLDLTHFWKLPLFQGVDMRRAQLQLFERMTRAHGLRGQLGVTTAGMDGPALMGLPTMYLTQEPNMRLGKWVGAVPGYQEVVREDGYLERISHILATWSDGALGHT
jgi:hypothetical protein